MCEEVKESPVVVPAAETKEESKKESPVVSTEVEKGEEPKKEIEAEVKTDKAELKRKAESDKEKIKKRRRRQYDDVPEENEDEDDDDDEDEDEDDTKLDAKLEEDDEEDDGLAEIDQSNIITGGRRTRGKVIDYVKTAKELDAEGVDEEDDDGDFNETPETK